MCSKSPASSLSEVISGVPCAPKVTQTCPCNARRYPQRSTMVEGFWRCPRLRSVRTLIVCSGLRPVPFSPIQEYFGTGTEASVNAVNPSCTTKLCVRLSSLRRRCTKSTPGAAYSAPSGADPTPKETRRSRMVRGEVTPQQSPHEPRLPGGFSFLRKASRTT